MFRIALTCELGVFGYAWRVTKCYHDRGMGQHATPVKVDRDHGRKRLMLLSDIKFARGPDNPRRLLAEYLAALPVELKIAREAEMRAQG